MLLVEGLMPMVEYTYFCVFAETLAELQALAQSVKPGRKMTETEKKSQTVQRLPTDRFWMNAS